MNRIKSIVLTAFIILFVFALGFPPLSASAATPTLSLSATIGSPGQTITITGTGFDNAYAINVVFGRNPGTTWDKNNSRYQVLGVIPAHHGGSFSTSGVIPTDLLGGTYYQVTSGTYYIFCTYKSTTGTDIPAVIATIEFDVLGGNLQMSPVTGPPGTQVYLTCMDFSGNEALQITFDDEQLSSLQALQATNGIISNLQVYIPPSTAGIHALVVTGKSSHVQSGKIFTVIPRIVIKPDEGKASSEITMVGQGLSANSPYNLSMDNQPLRTGTTDLSGSFTIAFPPNTFQMGDHVFSVVDGNGNSAQIQYSIFESTISLDPDSGGPAASVTLSGTGYKPNDTITITFEGIGNQVTAKSDANGSFTTTFTVPWETVGTKNITASDGENSKSVPFQVNASGLIDPLTNATYPGKVGDIVSIAGTGFTAGQIINVTFDGTKVQTVSIDGSQPQTDTVQSDGTFTGVFFIVPPTSSGAHTIQASDGTNTIDYSFYMENIPPSQPVILTPAAGSKTKGQPSFSWDEVTDDSGVTYTLQIATDQMFSASSIVAEEKNLTLPEFVYPGELNAVTKDTPYYWRVRAVDLASNEGPWSDPSSFFVNVGASLPQWAIYLIIVGAAIGLSIFTFWLGRKTAYY